MVLKTEEGARIALGCAVTQPAVYKTASRTYELHPPQFSSTELLIQDTSEIRKVNFDYVEQEADE